MRNSSPPKVQMTRMAPMAVTVGANGRFHILGMARDIVRNGRYAEMEVMVDEDAKKIVMRPLRYRTPYSRPLSIFDNGLCAFSSTAATKKAGIHNVALSKVPLAWDPERKVFEFSCAQQA